MKTARLLTGFLLIAFIVIMLFSLPATGAATVETFTVSPLSTTSIKVNIQNGTELNGSISTNGDIRFFINGPQGKPISDLGIASTSAKFTFTAPEDGNYSLNFENGRLTPTDVSLVFDAQSEITSIAGSQTIPAYVLVIAATAGCLVVVTILALFPRRKSRKKALGSTDCQSNRL